MRHPDAARRARSAILPLLLDLPAVGAEAPTGARVLLPESLPPPALSAGEAPRVTVAARAEDVPLRTLEDIPSWKHVRKMAPSPEIERRLLEDRLVVDPDRCYRELFELYEENRYRPVLLESREDPAGDVFYRTFLKSMPSVVTPDVVLHNLHLFFDYTLAEVEQRAFLPALDGMLSALLEETLRRQPEIAATELEVPARDLVAYLAVGRALLRSGSLVGAEEAAAIDDTAELTREIATRTLASAERLLGSDLPPGARSLAKGELERVVRAAGQMRPGILDYPDEHKEDYTQYTVRGHYVRTPVLQGYFRAMMWLSRMAFPFASDSAVRSAMLLTLAAGSREDVIPAWQRTDDSIAFLAGPGDDPSFREWLPPFVRAFGRSPSVKDLADSGRFAAFEEALSRLEPPRIQGVVTKEVHGPALSRTAAFHLFPQRRVPDAVIFQGLVDPKVPNRNMVTALEVPEVLGSGVAAAILEPLGLRRDPAYARERDALARSVPEMLAQGRDVTSVWLAALRGLWRPVPEGFPAFMRGAAYGHLRLSSSLASYAELKHDTVLYAKQAAAELGGPDFQDTEVSIDERGYVIPEVETYARVSHLLAALRKGLADRGLFPASLGKPYGRFETLVRSLREISEKELRNDPLSPQELDLVKFIGGDLEHFWRETFVSGEPPAEPYMLDQALAQNNAQIVADVFTGPDRYLHVATGYVHPVFVVFARDGKLHIGRGGVMSYHEMVAPRRLDDAAWRAQLAAEEGRPVPPPWTAAFTAPASAEGCSLYYWSPE